MPNMRSDLSQTLIEFMSKTKMNSITFSSLFYGLAVLATTALGQEQGACGCAPQPTIIQLSCNGGSSYGRPPPIHRPPPPPASAHTTSAYYPTESENESHTTAAPPTFDPANCEMDDHGYPIHTPEGGWPPGYQLRRACAGPNIACGPAEVITNPSFTKVPPKHWNGIASDLDYELVPGTPEYNVAMCWPIRKADGNDYSWGFGNNMFPGHPVSAGKK